MSKTIILKDDTAALFGRVKAKLLEKEPSIRFTDDLTIKRALQGFLNANR